MLVGRVPGMLAMLAAVAGAARAGTVDGYEWPPDPKRYDPPGIERTSPS
jgi:hypothetical protein